MLCANVGDIKALIATETGYAQLTADHKLEDSPNEIERAMEGKLAIIK